MAYIEHRLGKTHFTRRGRQRLTPIIWLHGGPGGTHRPDSPVFTLADQRPVFAYTQIGGGKSSITEKRHWNIRTFVTELDLLIKAWELSEFHLMGGSWGTTLALEYYLRKRGRGVRSLVFQSPLFNTADWQRDADKLVRRLPAETRKIIRTCHAIGATDSGVYRKAMQEYYLRHVLRNRKKLKAMFDRPAHNGNRIYEHMWGPSEFAATGTLSNYDRVDDLRRIKVPTMIICGEHDEAQPSTGIRYANRIDGCHFAEIAGASHAIWEERPAQIRRVIASFLAEVESAC